MKQFEIKEEILLPVERKIWHFSSLFFEYLGSEKLFKILILTLTFYYSKSTSSEKEKLFERIYKF
jgi:hypothetical protein